jgi:hypothetical protein
MQARRTQANWLHLPQKKGHPTERVPMRQRAEINWTRLGGPGRHCSALYDPFQPVGILAVCREESCLVPEASTS